MFFGEKGGAGLGLLQMARRSSNPIQYNFSPVNDKSKLFQYQIDFSIHKGERILERDKVLIGENITLLEEIYDEDIIFLFKGDFKKKMLMLFLISSRQILGFKQKKEFNDYRVFTLPLNLSKIFQDTEKMLGDLSRVFCLIRNHNGFYLSTGNYKKWRIRKS